MDDTIRTPEDIERVLKLPVLGYIGAVDMKRNEIVDLHVLKHPRSPVSEAFRSLRTNLEFTNVDQGLKKILVTSSGPGEGKTMVAVNLAAVIALSGKRVLLIDADMRRPRVHSIFGVSNHVGLSTLFRGNMTVRSVMRAVDGLENVFIITSGSPPPNPMELLASAKMDAILQEACGEVDMIVVDSPPSLVADYQVLSTKLDGVLLIIQPGHTQSDAAVAMLEQLDRVDARTLGVVLNKISRHTSNYGGYNYYSPHKYGEYYQQDQPAQPEPQFQPQLQVENPPVRLLLPREAPPAEIYTPEAVVESKEMYTDLPVRERTDVYASLSDIPAARNVITKPRPSSPTTRPVEVPEFVHLNPNLQDVESVEMPAYNTSKHNQENFRSILLPAYSIGKFDLEYWYDEQGSEKSEK